MDYTSIPQPGMCSLIQYIDGMDSIPVMTALLPCGMSIPQTRNNDIQIKRLYLPKYKAQWFGWVQRK
ncbi:protein-tyrosine phosphatase family protein [Algicola sagamiensis]|uniref:hypothetical protein n=1 Tax=Algicola sagamiensis TaxID=163869 RepID=UPI00036E06F6|nr:hypothetical protein [Algicola sagamiensis]